MTKNVPKGRFRGTAKQGKEKRYDCTICGDKKGNLEVNEEKGVFSCWACGFSGTLLGSTPRLRRAGGGKARRVGSSGFGGSGNLEDLHLDTIPDKARLYLEKAGLDPQWVAREYQLWWDDTRICWPTGGGQARRSINDWDEPKVLVTGMGASDGAIIGIHRVVEGSDVVITEGDKKGASIPLPWVGLGILGHTLHAAQLERILEKRPGSIVIFEDEDFPITIEASTRFPTCKSPFGGPDDIPMAERVKRILHAE